MDISLLLLATGEFLLEVLPAGILPADGETSADLALTVGALFWVIALSACAIVAWRARQHLRAEAVRGLQAGAAVAGSAALAWPSSRWNTSRPVWRSAWGMIWRAQIVHLFIYAFVPLIFGIVSLALFVMFLPLTAMGPGEKHLGFDGRFEHLRRPACWQFVSWCPSPTAEFRGVTAQETLRCERGGACPTPPIVARDSWRGVWKLTWAIIALAWIVIAAGRARNASRPT